MAGRLRSAYDMQNEKVDLGLVSRMIITTTIVISFWQFIFSCFSFVFFFHLLQISFSFFLFGLKKLFYYYYYYSLFFFLKYKKKKKFGFCIQAVGQTSLPSPSPLV